MQEAGHPVSQEDIGTKTNSITGLLGLPSLTSGWYQRILGRNSDIGPRQAQPIMARNSIDTDSKVAPCRILNMDETEFLTRPKSRLVVAVKGPPQLWSKTTTANFHLTVVACGSAVGWIAPPCFKEKRYPLKSWMTCRMPVYQQQIPDL
ncbi:TPA: hypothetical protein N0F65_000169 [Lagenidium giganteum]|uniref:Transposase n=1 Tax=Lagenidium giganteum TaxID=4803 RepID=A0AAV2YS42_9STRA|nr:TPA: hypothetical protein N0F65_000169 [Lagenidium giganteum]